MRDISLDSIFESFDPTDAGTPSDLKGGTVTIWLSPEYKEKYDRIQRMSGRRFIKKVRELLLAAIDRAEARTT